MNTTLIGRERQLATMEQLIAATVASQPTPHTLLISGEAGIGKSSLLAALRERVIPDWTVLEGACFEPYQAEPYAPIVDMLGRHRTNPRIARHIGALEPSNGLALLPGIARLGTFNQANWPATDFAQNQRRILKDLSDLFARLAADGPLLISIEDLHWSDAATLTFLPILAHTIANLPALLAVTYRTDETGPSLAAMLAELDRRRLALEIALPRLTRADVGALARKTRGIESPTDAAFLDTIYELTDGNPFFVEELVLALPTDQVAVRSTGAMPIPRSIREAVSRRANQLSPGARDLLTLAAVLGRRFDFDILLHVTGSDETNLLTQVKELIAARLIVEETDERLAFRHALTCAAVYADLLARERRLLHRRLGEVLEPNVGEAQAADLARHFLLGGA